MVTDSSHAEPFVWTQAHFVGNHPALDFVNTLSHRRDAAKSEDRLRSPKDLRHWANAVGILDLTNLQEAEAQTEQGADMAQIRALRERAHDLLEARIARRPPKGADITAIATILNDPTDALDIPKDGDHSRIICRDARIETLQKTLALLVLDAVFRLPPHRLGACPACGWMFYDTTRGGRRKWCSMSTCGNRAKVRQHRKQTGNRGQASGTLHG